jgi:hypothetical protein
MVIFTLTANRFCLFSRHRRPRITVTTKPVTSAVLSSHSGLSLSPRTACLAVVVLPTFGDVLRRCSCQPLQTRVAAALALALLACVRAQEIGGVHAAFYLWYGNPQSDGRYQHWDHEVLPHWTQSVREQYPHGADAKFRPPEDIHAPYYPARGCYSSTSTETLVSQFTEMRENGIDTAVRGSLLLALVALSDGWLARRDGPGH